MAQGSDRRVRYSQNLLHNKRLVSRLVGRADISADDVVLEIGPGRGIITQALAERCGHVIAIEKDPQSTAALRDRFERSGNVTVFAADFLDFPLPVTAFKVFSNIPYNITAAIVGKLTAGVVPPLDSYLVMQSDAAGKLMGQPRQTLTSLTLFPVFDLSIEHHFQRSDFQPVPAVDSVLLRTRKRDEPLIPVADLARYRDFVTALFTAWKPNLGEALRAVLPSAVLPVIDREFAAAMYAKPGDVRPEVWLRLFQMLSGLSHRGVWRKIDGAAAKLAQQQAGLQKQHRSRTSGRR